MRAYHVSLEARMIDVRIPAVDRDILRRLAERLRFASESEDNLRKIGLWSAINSLNSGTPVILTSPEGAWGEILPEAAMECVHPLARAWEYQLRVLLTHHEVIRDDRPLEACLDIGWSMDGGSFGVEIPHLQGESRGSYVWDPPIKDLARDLSLLKFREPVVDRTRTMSEIAEAESVFEGILRVRLRGPHFWTNGLTGDVIKLIGLERMMFLMYDDPEGLHRLMAWKRDEQAHYLSILEQENLLTLNNASDMIASGGIGWTSELPGAGFDGVIRLSDLWGFAESQETVGVSPAMFDEFVFPYQKPILERYGLNCYGCCEGVEKRLDTILKIPRLRRVSVSPWADQEACAQKLGRQVVFSRKPNPSPVCTGFNETEIREDLRRTLRIAGKLNLEIILKDTHTVQNDRTRIPRWVEIAREESNKLA